MLRSENFLSIGFRASNMCRSHHSLIECRDYICPGPKICVYLMLLSRNAYIKIVCTHRYGPLSGHFLSLRLMPHELQTVAHFVKFYIVLCYHAIFAIFLSILFLDP